VEIHTRVGDRYQLNHPQLDIDLWHLQHALDRAAAAADPGERAVALREVIDTYHGELAAGQQWPWLAPLREAIRRRILDAYTEFATADPHTTVTALTRALAIDPYNEDLHRRAVRAHAATGRAEPITGLLAAFTARLATIGEQPDPDTIGLAARLTDAPKAAD
jgi:DNA-binding SARP family transcriptional activator